MCVWCNGFTKVGHTCFIEKTDLFVVITSAGGTPLHPTDQFVESSNGSGNHQPKEPWKNRNWMAPNEIPEPM
jgi:hypothetical protein